MKKLLLTSLFIASFATGAQAEQLDVKVQGVDTDQPIPAKFANCVAKGAEKSATGEDISPKITWSKGPDGTKSYAVIVVDRDVPADFTDAGKEGKTLSADAPRQNFYHWLLLNIPATTTSIPEGAGKAKDYGQQLVNDYLKFSGLQNNAQNQTKFRGYDGPCPPWNDERVHNYHFKVYALSDKFKIGEEYNGGGDDIIRKITPYVLAEGEVVGTYTLNSSLNTPPTSTAVAPSDPAKK